VATQPLRIHSVAEAYLLLMVTPCEACGKGPLEAAGHEPVDLPGSAGRRLAATCKACGHEQAFVFDLASVDEDEAGEPSGSALPRINPTDEPSRVIDVAQWLMLFETIVRSADRASDPAESRRLGYEAAQCLEEALKFYPAEGEWPSESAFFHSWTLRRFREHKHLFARTRLVQMRGRLPSLIEMEERLAGESRSRRRWWAFWQRRSKPS